MEGKGDKRSCRLLYMEYEFKIVSYGKNNVLCDKKRYKNLSTIHETSQYILSKKVYIINNKTRIHLIMYYVMKPELLVVGDCIILFMVERLRIGDTILLFHQLKARVERESKQPLFYIIGNPDILSLIENFTNTHKIHVLSIFNTVTNIYKHIIKQIMCHRRLFSQLHHRVEEYEYKTNYS